MIRITVELLSAVTGETTKLGEMHIANDGTGSYTHGHYDGKVLKKPNFKSTTRMGKVINHPRHAQTIWHLIGKMLKNMGYV